MQSLRQLCACFVLVLAFSLPAVAGEIQYPGVAGIMQQPVVAGDIPCPGIMGQIECPGLNLILSLLF
jgi:hypothetical protein